MNKQYILLDDAAYVTNEKGEIKETKKTNHLEEKLVKENELEQVENKISSTRKKIDEKEFSRKKAFDMCKTLCGAALFAIIVFPLIMSNDIVANEMPLLEMVGSKYLAATIITLSATVPVCGLMSLIGFIGFPRKKEIRGLEKRTELLEKLKSKVSKELENLIKQEKEITEFEKDKEGIEKIHFVPTDSKEEELKLIEVYSNNEEMFEQLYKGNKLEDFLEEKGFAEFQINYIRNLLLEDLSNENKYADSSEVKSTKRVLKKERKTTKK